MVIFESIMDLQKHVCGIMGYTYPFVDIYTRDDVDHYINQELSAQNIVTWTDEEIGVQYWEIV